ncbi:MAG: T-protein [Lentisphaerae bacterium ADurb.Bin242]|nr:MAG: T-protein [Lentisphaerae bacterium ADurb.Bin242]
MPEKIAVIGLGMLGTSLCAALGGKGYERRVWSRRPEVGKWALENGIADHICGSVEEALEESDIAILCLPIPTILEFIKEYAPFMKKTLVTDIGSVKGCIEKAALENGIRFVGSHPMAGTEKSGPEAMVPDIYENASVFVVPSAASPEEDTVRVERLWKSIGAKPCRISAQEHDLLVAHTSHVPHIVSSALALSVLDADGELKEKRFAGCASGFRDTIRVAASSPKMWREILSHNREAVLEAMAAYEERCARLKQMIADGDFDAFEREFAKGKCLIEEWRKARNILSK